jgi:CubicO group peptidase (beta-lactamase class C family)
MHDLQSTLSLIAITLTVSACAAAPQGESAAPPPASATSARADLPDSIGQAVDRVFGGFDNSHSPGCAVGAVRGDDLVLARGYGMASLEHDIRITPQTAFYAGSVSKQFAAFAVALLADQGELSLDDDIRRWIPEVPDFGRAITVRHLLHHTSGLRDYLNLLGLTGWPADGRITRAEFMDFMGRQQELNFAPGSQHLYSNTGYVLLSILVEQVSGQSLREFAEAHIFEPLGMSRTTFRDDHTMLIKDRALGYTPDGDAEAGYRLSMPGFDVVGDGGLYTTIGDLAQWAENLGSHRVGGPEVAAMLLTPGVLASGDTLDYALGIQTGEHRGLRTVGHGGSYAGYQAVLTRYTDHGLTIFALCNRSDAVPWNRSLEVAEAFLGEYMEPEQRIEPVTADDGVAVDPALLETYAGKYRAGDGFTFTWESEGGQLFYVSSSGERRLEIALSDTLFQLNEATGQVMFHREADGSVQRATLVSDSDRRALHRIEPWRPSAAELTTYGGRYFSPELETFYTLVVDEGQLVARHRWNEDVRFMPAVRDMFQGYYPLVQVRFERAEDGQITGFLVSAGRTQNLRFERQE